MAKKKIVLEFIFDTSIPYEDEPDYIRTELRKIKLGKDTTMTADERGEVAEEAGQSDFWQVDVHNDIFSVIDSGRTIKYD